MTPELKEELKQLVAKHRNEYFHFGFVCIGPGDSKNPLIVKFGIEKSRLYTPGMADLPHRIERGYSGDTSLMLYYITNEYYDAILNDTVHLLPEDTGPKVKSLREVFAEIFQDPYYKYGNENGQKNTQKNEEIGEKTPENTKNTQKMTELEELLVQDRVIQEEFLKRNSLSIGSKMKVLRKFKDYGKTPVVNWAEAMNETIGKVGEIVKIDPLTPSIHLKFKGEQPSHPLFSGDRIWVFPYHSLQPYYEQDKALQLENSYMALVKDDGSTLVNGLSVTFDELEELYFKAGKAKTKQKSSGAIDDGTDETWKDSDRPFGF